MNKQNFFLCLLIVVLFSSCKNDKDEILFFPGQLDLLKNEVNASFDSLNNSINAAVNVFSASGFDAVAMRSKLLELYNESTFAAELVYTSPDGIMEIIEPAAYYSYEGSNISAQPHVIKAFQTKQPVLSDGFIVVEGYQAAVTIHPVIHNNQLIGAISAVIVPANLLKRIIEPVVKNQDFEVWVMEKTGLTLYDQDEEEIGINVLTHPMYDDFPVLRQACLKMAGEESGETKYSFYQTGTNIVVNKKTYWNTFHMQGNQWKIIYVKPE
ncbi:MAG: cache domain-containing protein [Bacteroidales bacterium]|nr:cache domain-containing protein [Bacteroidales bacterium]MDP2236278.1 cache domain-containing protein [Bacteroidales bacterium]